MKAAVKDRPPVSNTPRPFLQAACFDVEYMPAAWPEQPQNITAGDAARADWPVLCAYIRTGGFLL